ncbi:hypothetical protein [Natronomonas sp. EA1]|uniref:hypothetical protein n=1 Tax=Natronomonas sp. EA1 TaxID=3421655 RepID=UPI003EB805FD
MVTGSLFRLLFSPVGTVAGLVFILAVGTVVAATRGRVGPNAPQRTAVALAVGGAALLAAGIALLFTGEAAAIPLVNEGLDAVQRGVSPSQSTTAALGWLFTVGSAGFVGAFVLAGVDAAIRDHDHLPPAEGVVLIVNGGVTCLAVGIGLSYARGSLQGTAIAGVSITLAVFLLTLGSLLLVVQKAG